MGLAATVQNEVTGELFSISTVPRKRELPLPGLGKTYVICESAVYAGKANPLATTLGKKPLFVAFSLHSGERYDIDQFHDIFTCACQQLEFNSAEELADMLHERGIHTNYEQSRQLLFGGRKIDFLYVY